MKRIVLVFLLLSLASLSYAGCALYDAGRVTIDLDTPLSVDRFIGSPVCWLKDTYIWIGRTANLDYYLKGIAYAIASILLVSQILKMMGSGSLSMMTGLIIRTVIVLALCAGSTGILNFMQGQWIGLYNAGQDKWTRAGGYSDEINGLITDVTNLLPQAYAYGAVAKMGGLDANQDAGGGYYSLDTNRDLSVVTVATNLVTILMMTPFLAYAALMYLSGLQLLIVLLFWEICVVFILLPDGIGWFRRLIGQYLSALLKVLFLPFLFATVIDIGLRRPLYAFKSYLEAGLNDINQLGAIIGAYMPKNRLIGLVNGGWDEYVNQIPAYVGGLMGTLVTVVIGWLIAIMGLILGMAVGVYIMNQFSGLITSVFGGFSGGGSLGNPARQMMQTVRGAALGIMATGRKGVDIADRTKHTGQELYKMGSGTVREVAKGYRGAAQSFRESGSDDIKRDGALTGRK